MAEYLASSWAVDFDDPIICTLIEERRWAIFEPIERAESIFHFVRDEISHAYDVQSPIVTCRASEVLQRRVGLCYAKSHLLAALMRATGIPAGLCYQRLTLTDDPADGLILHGLNAILLPDANRWIRLDARGNKPGVAAEFSVEQEILAFSVRPELGEVDYPFVYAEPDQNVVQALVDAKDGLELYRCGLPTELAHTAAMVQSSINDHKS